jgi:hypothetical protein
MKKSIFYILLFTFFLSCQKDLQNSSSDSGVGGSLARFAIVGTKMYVVTTDQLKTFDITNPKQLTLTDTVRLGLNDIETIFAFDKNLFIGSRSALHIYKLDANGVPRFGSIATHSWGCDPVVANDTVAFVTTRNGQRNCQTQNNSFANQLIVYDVKDIQKPRQLTIVNMTFPNGVGLDKNLLFVCDAGVKMYDISQATKPILRKHFNNIDANDVIPLNGQLLVVGDRNLTQMDYKDTANVKVISKFELRK